jgi:tetratricopeptide (TPR) repeat protein
MQAVANYFRRFFFVLGDTLAMPFLVMRGLWRDGGRGRTLLLGLPSVIVFLIAATMFGLALNSHERLLKSYQLAQQHAVADGRTAEAINYTYKLIQLRPTEDKLKFELAKLLMSDNSEEFGDQNRQRALALFSALAPDDRAGLPEAHVRRANILWRAPNIDARDKIKTVESQLDLALLGDSQNVEARTLKAELLLLRKEYQPALEIFTELFRDDVSQYPKIVEILAALGRPAEGPPIVRQAIQRYKEQLREEPGNTAVIRSLAAAHTQIAEFDEAIALLRKALDEATGEADQRALSQTLSRIYISKSRMYQQDLATNPESRKNFLADIGEAYRLDSSSETAKSLLTEFSLQRFPEAAQAREIYDALSDPDNAPDTVLYRLGTHELLNGNAEQGVHLLEKGLQQNPGNHIILNNLAFALMETDVDRALSLANRAVELNAGSPNYHDTRGNIYMRKGDWQNAIRDLERALAAGMDKNVKLYENLVTCYEKLGLVEGAANYRKKIEELGGGQ